MFLAWYDADRKKKAVAKFNEAVERHIEKFGNRPTLCLAHPEIVEEIAKAAASLEIEVAAKSFLPKNTFYVGHEDEPEPVLSAA